MTEVARLKQNPNVKVFQAPIRLFYDVLLQSISAPFDNKTLRQAINWGIDRERFTGPRWSGWRRPTSQPFPSHSWAWFEDLDKTYTFNLDKAKDLMAQAGYPNGLEIACLTCSARQKELTALAQIMAADLGKIGIKLNIEDVEAAVYDERHLAGKFQMAMHNYGRANLDPSTMFRGAAAWHHRHRHDQVRHPRVPQADGGRRVELRSERAQAEVQGDDPVHPGSVVRDPGGAEPRVLRHALTGPGVHHGRRVQYVDAGGLARRLSRGTSRAEPGGAIPRPRDGSAMSRLEG